MGAERRFIKYNHQGEEDRIIRTDTQVASVKMVVGIQEEEEVSRVMMSSLLVMLSPGYLRGRKLPGKPLVLRV